MAQLKQHSNIYGAMIPDRADAMDNIPGMPPNMPTAPRQPDPGPPPTEIGMSGEGAPPPPGVDPGGLSRLSRFPARGSESPRERSAPQRPMEPTPMAGSAMTVPTGVRPFTPMGTPDVGSMATPASAGLYGRLGGLQGGGLGVPLDPVPNEQLDLSALIQMLMGGNR